MNIKPILQGIHDSRLSAFIRENAVAFPLLESLHVLGIALVLGTIAIVDLRLLGYGAHRRSARRLIHELLPLTWIAFGVAVTTGGLMFVSNVLTYAENSFFWYKMAVLFAAGVNMSIFHLGIYRRIGEWDEISPPPRSARVAGLGSLSLWAVVVVLGRWIGFA
ncbi:MULTISPECIES: DUF6644 family protein [Burkholderia cepacia complex]|uniref:DUF6644 family protein n=1 Tax=Burkholderia cepacia complex TaxID=87882 RepID=UPI0022EB4170|nr:MULTISPECIES: DUF6644 family protein [Burkholderia cepacia complex]MDA3672164.1 hypothetical protein [Burkholderia cenocepacia]MDA3681481.1 hypothetical protein [Burkholderia cenocepacia]MDA3689094.1 hypothetical protein [Burkholderia cenocepacia]MDA3696473.1 hypothetical protein [Burkholderia cenocepacia]MDA3703876.1 hypothetical protein [Burkholderia cenocepacia]